MYTIKNLAIVLVWWMLHNRTSLDKINKNARDLYLLKAPKKYKNENESFCKNQDCKSEKVIL